MATYWSVDTARKTHSYRIIVLVLGRGQGQGHNIYIGKKGGERGANYRVWGQMTAWTPLDPFGPLGPKSTQTVQNWCLGAKYGIWGRNEPKKLLC